MKSKLIALFLAFVFCFVATPSFAQVRTFNAPRRPLRLLTKQFAANANVFTIVDPSKAGTPLTLTSATGRSNMDGSVTISMQAGFTAPITLSFYIWQQDSVTPANAGWTRLGNAATGTSSYSVTLDNNYTLATVVIPENTDFIVLSSTAVTGNVYTDSIASPSNLNTVAGY